MFADKEALVKDLELGIGVVATPFRGYEPPLRLRTYGVCGIASLALSRHLDEQSIQNQVMISTPKIEADPDLRHVFVVADINGQETVIDPSYSSMLALAGMTPGYVVFGGRDMFPKEKIATFALAEREKFLTKMRLLAKYCMDHYEPITTDKYFNNAIDFNALTDEEIEAQYGAIWDPDNLSVYEPGVFYDEKGRALADLIDPAHAQILD